MKVLVRAANWIGDAVMSLPAIRAIRARYPEAALHVLARPWVAGLYEHESAIDAIIPLEGAPGLHDPAAKRRSIMRLRAGRYDAAVLLPNSFESAAIIWLAGVTERIGYARDGRSSLLTIAPAPPGPGEIPRHERYYYLELLRRAGVIDSIPSVTEIVLDKAADAGGRGRELLRLRGLRGRVIGISPGAAYGGAKRWLPERFGAAAKRLSIEFGAEVVVFGSEAERDLCEHVAAIAGGTNLAGRTSLREFIDMMAACLGLLTNDSGAMHIASALGIPTVTIFGPTDEFATGPTGPLAAIVREPVSCAPCLLRECPIDHRCMTGVDVERVVSIARADVARAR